MPDKYLFNNGGQYAEREATSTSTGVAQAGKVVALGNDGKLDNSVFPTGIGAETKILATSENLSAGDLVNVWNDGGTPKARKADASNGRRAMGFVLASVTAPANATVYAEGMITGLSSLTSGAIYYLSNSVAGGVTTTSPTTSGHITQEIGVAFSTTEISFEPQRPITLA